MLPCRARASDADSRRPAIACQRPSRSVPGAGASAAAMTPAPGPPHRGPLGGPTGLLRLAPRAAPPAPAPALPARPVGMILPPVGPLLGAGQRPGPRRRRLRGEDLGGVALEVRQARQQPLQQLGRE